MRKFIILLFLPLLFNCTSEEDSSTAKRQLIISNEKPNTDILFASSEIFSLYDISVNYGETKTFDIDDGNYDGKTAVRIDYDCSSKIYTAADGSNPIYTNFNERKTYTIVLKSSGTDCSQGYTEEL